MNENKNLFSVNVTVNGKKIKSKGMVKDAIILAGVKTSHLFHDSHPCTFDTSKSEVFIPCNSGACWACMVKINGRPAVSCITPLSEGMEINTFSSINHPLRILSGFGLHTVGGVGTPYPLKKNKKPIEVVGFTHGCNLVCPQCQNDKVAFTQEGNLLDAEETAQILLGLHSVNDVNTITFSGGESTLNRPWLIKAVKSIRNADKEINIHIDTNGTVLTQCYIDELINAGMNQIGIDLKGIRLATFQKITGLGETELARKLLNNSWGAVKYILEEYDVEYPLENMLNPNSKNSSDSNIIIENKKTQNSIKKPKIFLGIGIPYNKSLISKKEIKEIGNTIKNIDSKVQVSVLDYRPAFRKKELEKPTFEEMIDVKNILNGQGLENVIVQTEKGHFGP
ncbi:radical SAM protein [Methanobacterium alcaliphilum]|uniref:radical SAM protein n=1 Tax=Methanobacterium alcaliphilum TaxID=392018 RepID=UPI002009E2B1|nr:radical SAM protein [Methanobacterium alcaliphilum]MCK9152424.1 radical SAM protein [Methanobacterium alcaliphilum]